VVEEGRVVGIGTGAVLKEQDAPSGQAAEESLSYERSLSEGDLVELAHAHDRVVLTQRETTFDAPRPNPGIPMGRQPASSRRVALEPDERRGPSGEQRSELALVRADLEGSSRPAREGGENGPALAVLLTGLAFGEGWRRVAAGAGVGDREGLLSRLRGRAENSHGVACRISVR
jgi:hypothetical protein